MISGVLFLPLTETVFGPDNRRFTYKMTNNYSGILRRFISAFPALVFFGMMLLASLAVSFACHAEEIIAGLGFEGVMEAETENPNSWENSEPAPFTVKIRFDEDYEQLTRKDTKKWRRKTPAGYYLWNDELVTAYFKGLKVKYDSAIGEVSFTTHLGEKMLMESDNCGWHMNIDVTKSRFEDAVDAGEKIVDPAWNSGCVYSSKNGVGSKYVEVSIEEQKVYLIEDGEVIFETDCVTGTRDYSDTKKGVFQVQTKASPSVLRDVDKNGNKYEQPVEYWIGFNGSQGMHDAIWRGDFGKEYYKTWGSHGCVNLPLESAEQIYKLVAIYTPVIVY